MVSYQITQWSHELFRLQVKPGGIYIDATMGNGHDTLFLCELAGETGKVIAREGNQCYRTAFEGTSYGNQSKTLPG